jgi:hypothetical protein
MEQTAVILCVLVFVLGTAGVMGFKLRSRIKHTGITVGAAVNPVQLEARNGQGGTTAILRPSMTQMDGKESLDSAPGLLRNADVMDLARAGVGGEVINKMIGKMSHDFHIDPKSMLAMKLAGVPDPVLSQILDTTNLPLHSPPAKLDGGLNQAPKPMLIRNGGSDTVISRADPTPGRQIDPDVVLSAMKADPHESALAEKHE